MNQEPKEVQASGRKGERKAEGKEGRRKQGMEKSQPEVSSKHFHN